MKKLRVDIAYQVKHPYSLLFNSEHLYEEMSGHVYMLTKMRIYEYINDRTFFMRELKNNTNEKH